MSRSPRAQQVAAENSEWGRLGESSMGFCLSIVKGMLTSCDRSKN